MIFLRAILAYLADVFMIAEATAMRTAVAEGVTLAGGRLAAGHLLGHLPRISVAILNGWGLWELCTYVMRLLGWNVAPETVKATLRAAGLDPNVPVRELNVDGIRRAIEVLNTANPNSDHREQIASAAATTNESINALAIEARSNFEVETAQDSILALHELLGVPVNRVAELIQAIEAGLNMEPDDRQTASRMLRRSRGVYG